MTLRPEPGQMRWMQLRVGLFATAVLALLAVANLRLDAVGSIFSRPVEFTVLLQDGLGLREGSPGDRGRLAGRRHLVAARAAVTHRLGAPSSPRA